MCEIAVVDPEEFPVQALMQLSTVFHEEQGDGLGVVAVKEDEDSFEYRTYKSTDPHWHTLYSFFGRHIDDAWRFIVHGRAMTSGKVNRETAHPIEVDCPKCDVDYVVHNGSVRNYETKQTTVMNKGHQLNTMVDTELIGHYVESIPDSIDDHGSTTYSVYGNLNYLVLSDDGILVRAKSRYFLSDDFTMTCSLTKFDSAEEFGFDPEANNEWALIKPGADGPEIDVKERTTRTRTSSSGTTYRNGNKYRYSGEATGTTSADDDKYVVRYEDLSSWETITAIRVAPGVLKVIELESDEREYIFEDENPRLYYYYVPEDMPEEYKDDTTTQTTVADHVEGDVEEAIEEFTSSTVEKVVDDADEADVKSVTGQVAAAAARGAEEALEGNE